MNMPKRYSEMTPHELREEIGALKEQAVKAEQLGIVNEFDVLMMKNGNGSCLYDGYKQVPYW